MVVEFRGKDYYTLTGLRTPQPRHRVSQSVVGHLLIEGKVIGRGDISQSPVNMSGLFWTESVSVISRQVVVYGYFGVFGDKSLTYVKSGRVVKGE